MSKSMRMEIVRNVVSYCIVIKLVVMIMIKK